MPTSIAELSLKLRANRLAALPENAQQESDGGGDQY
jgi:hypothetical protein